MDEENNEFYSLNRTSKILGCFSLVFLVIYLLATKFGAKIPEEFLNLLPSFIGGTGLTGLILSIIYLKRAKEELSKATIGLGLNSIGVFATICVIML